MNIIYYTALLFPFEYYQSPRKCFLHFITEEDIPNELLSHSEEQGEVDDGKTKAESETEEAGQRKNTFCRFFTYIFILRSLSC